MGWFENLKCFADRHYSLENRVALKVKALQIIANICLLGRDEAEEKLIDRVMLPHLKHLDVEPDTIVRQTGVKFIVDYLMGVSSKKGHDLLQILEKVSLFYNNIINVESTSSLTTSQPY